VSPDQQYHLTSGALCLIGLLMMLIAYLANRRDGDPYMINIVFLFGVLFFLFGPFLIALGPVAR
jgi:sugar phosphate permease